MKMFNLCSYLNKNKHKDMLQIQEELENILDSGVVSVVNITGVDVDLYADLLEWLNNSDISTFSNETPVNIEFEDDTNSKISNDVDDIRSIFRQNSRDAQSVGVYDVNSLTLEQAYNLLNAGLLKAGLLKPDYVVPELDLRNGNRYEVNYLYNLIDTIASKGNTIEQIDFTGVRIHGTAPDKALFFREFKQRYSYIKVIYHEDDSKINQTDDMYIIDLPTIVLQSMDVFNIKRLNFFALADTIKPLLEQHSNVGFKVDSISVGDESYTVEVLLFIAISLNVYLGVDIPIVCDNRNLLIKGMVMNSYYTYPPNIKLEEYLPSIYKSGDLLFLIDNTVHTILYNKVAYTKGVWYLVYNEVPSSIYRGSNNIQIQNHSLSFNDISLHLTLGKGIHLLGIQYTNLREIIDVLAARGIQGSISAHCDTFFSKKKYSDGLLMALNKVSPSMIGLSTENTIYHFIKKLKEDGHGIEY